MDPDERATIKELDELSDNELTTLKNQLQKLEDTANETWGMIADIMDIHGDNIIAEDIATTVDITNDALMILYSYKAQAQSYEEIAEDIELESGD